MTTNTTEVLKRLAPQFVELDGRERLATPSPWVRDGFNMAALLKCTAKRGSSEARHTCGDYTKMAECEGVNWKNNALFLEEARNQTRPLLDSYAEMLEQRQQFEQEKADAYQAGVLSVVNNLSEHWGKMFANASAGLTDPQHLNELEFWEETFQEPLRAVREAIAVNGAILNKLGKES